MGLEPTTFGSEVRRAIHYATGPEVKTLSSLYLKSIDHPSVLTIFTLNGFH
jgi:hypothetical protein